MPRLRDYITTTEAAKVLGLSRQRVSQLAEAGTFPSIRVGVLLLVKRKAVEKYSPDRKAQEFGRKRGGR